MTEFDDKARINRHHLAGEIAVAVFRMYTEGPGVLASRHKFPRTSLTAEGTTAIKLILKKKSKEGLEYKEECDDLDYYEEIGVTAQLL